MVLQNTFAFTLFLKENKLKRFLCHGPILMHCIIKSLFYINGFLCENKCKERQHSTNSGSFFTFTLLLPISTVSGGNTSHHSLQEILNKSKGLE